MRGKSQCCFSISYIFTGLNLLQIMGVSIIMASEGAEKINGRNSRVDEIKIRSVGYSSNNCGNCVADPEASFLV